MKNKKRTMAARIAIVAIAAILLMITLAACLPGSERTLIDLEVVPERVTEYGTLPQEYWARYRLDYGDGTCEYYWVQVTRQQFAKLKSQEGRPNE